MNGQTPGALRVAHLINKYLAYSQCWIHPQLFAPGIESFVVTRALVPGSGGAFPHPSVVALSERFPFRYRLALIADPGRLRRPCTLAKGPIQAGGATLVHAHFGHHAWRFLPAVRAIGLPLVTAFYGRDLSVLPRRAAWRRRYRELFDYGTTFLCQGPHMAGALQRLGCPADKIRLLAIGADLRESPFRLRTREEGEPLRVLFAARFTEKKGLPDAIRAVALASKDAAIELTVVGSADGDIRGRRESTRIRQALRETGLGGRVRFLGKLALPDLLRESLNHHVFLCPSKQGRDGDSEGGYPVIVAQMTATGMPCVATRHADMEVAVVDGGNGLVSAEGDVPGLAASLARLAREPALLSSFGQAGAEHAKAHLDTQVLQRDLAAIYREALRAAGGRRDRAAGAASARMPS